MAFFILTRFILVKYSHTFVKRLSQGTSSFALRLTTVSFDRGILYVLLGTDEAQSKRNLVRWLGKVVLAKAKIDPRTREQSGNVIPGRYAGLRQSEYALIEQKCGGVGK